MIKFQNKLLLINRINVTINWSPETPNLLKKRVGIPGDQTKTLNFK